MLIVKMTSIIQFCERFFWVAFKHNRSTFVSGDLWLRNWISQKWVWTLSKTPFIFCRQSVNKTITNKKVKLSYGQANVIANFWESSNDRKVSTLSISVFDQFGWVISASLTQNLVNRFSIFMLRNDSFSFQKMLQFESTK
jgi:hypothetical protein